MDVVTCVRCREDMRLGDDYYETPIGDFCPDCAEALFESWRRTMGDVIERI